MYKNFYGLRQNPFEITPDPYFLYPAKQYNNALGALYYGLRARKGLVVLTGEVGTGKTMLVRCLLSKLRHNNILYAYVFNSRLSPLEFLRYAVKDFGLKVDSPSKSNLLWAVNEFLIQRHNRGQYSVLVVDEAQLLRAEVLEEIRLLTNLETSQHKLLQIILVGQPELDGRLDSTSMRQLKQRIALRAHLKPLTWEETLGYVHWRLELAGAKGPAIFPREVIRIVYECSQGIPRLINNICENALISGYACSARAIAPSLIREVCAELRLDPKPPELVEAKPLAPNDQGELRQQLLETMHAMLEAME